MPDLRDRPRSRLERFAPRGIVVALSLCLSFVSGDIPAASVPTCSESAPPEAEHEAATARTDRWQQLDLALSDLAPNSQQARGLVPDLIAAAQHSDTPPVLRQRAILMLGRIGKPAQGAVPVFLRLLTEYRAAESRGAASVTPAEAAERRVWLLESLGDFGELANDAVPMLRRDLFDRSRSVDDRVQVADMLGQIGTVPAVSALADALRQWPPDTPSGEQLVKRTIVDCIGLSGPAGVVGLPALLRSIEDEDSSIRRKVCEAMTLFGPAGELASDALVTRLVLDDDEAVRDAAADTLAAIGPASVPVLIRLLESDQPDLQWRAARALGRIRSAAIDARVALEQVITTSIPTDTDHAEPLVQKARIEALAAHWEITRETSGVFARLIDELSSDDRQVRRRASELLIAPLALPDELRSRLITLSAGDSPAARAAAYVLRRRGAESR
ncbi:MAG: HEAT repeat domain-containing protein [Planctomycetota bacterium]|jgi:HEAT repeat protein